MPTSDIKQCEIETSHARVEGRNECKWVGDLHMSAFSGLASPLKTPFPKDLLVLDLETTGTDPVLHSTIEIGAVLLDRHTLEEVKAWSAVIKRQERNGTNPRSMALHGRSLDNIKSTGKDARQAVEEFFDMFGTDYLLTGWNIGFDVQFLRALLRHTGHTDAFDVIDYHRLDVWSISQFFSKAHSGLEDARITATALRRLVQLVPHSSLAVAV